MVWSGFSSKGRNEAGWKHSPAVPTSRNIIRDKKLMIMGHILVNGFSLGLFLFMCAAEEKITVMFAFRPILLVKYQTILVSLVFFYSETTWSFSYELHGLMWSRFFCSKSSCPGVLLLLCCIWVLGKCDKNCHSGANEWQTQVILWRYRIEQS